MGRAEFDPRLESLRGIAAMIVALYHGMSGFSASPGRLTTAINYLFAPINPASSVFFFFVLSGYVLGQSLKRDFDPVQFYVRRFFRIFPALVVSVLFAFALRSSISPNDQLSVSFLKLFSAGPNISDLIKNILLQSSEVNGPTWSIYPEVVGSAFLPVLVYIHFRAPAKWQWPLFAVVTIFLSFSSFKMMIWFYFGFCIPPAIALHMRARWLRLAAFCIGYLLIRYTGEHALYYKFNTVMPSAIGASLMIGAILSSDDFMNWLKMPATRFLGRISYSFYLLHWPIFYATAVAVSHIGMSGTASNILACLLSVLLAIIAATACHRWIEVPGIKIGKALWARSLAIGSAA